MAVAYSFCSLECVLTRPTSFR